MTFPNSGQYFIYSSELGNVRQADVSELDEPEPRNTPDYLSRNPQSSLNTPLYSISPNTPLNPYQAHTQQPFQNLTQHLFEEGPSVSQSMAGYPPTPIVTAPSPNFPLHNRQQSSSAFYPHPHLGVYPSADPSHQAGEYSNHYQNLPSFSIPYDVHYSINTPYYPYTPLSATSGGYKSTHMVPSTDMLPPPTDQGMSDPGAVGLPQSSNQRQNTRDPVTEIELQREDRRDLALRRPRSTVSGLNIRIGSQSMTPSSPSISLTSPSTPDPTPSVVSFAQDQSTSLPHTMIEDKSISQDELHTIFFPSFSRINVPSSSGSVQNSKWTCQWENCHELVRSQDRMAHALEHQGKKRFTCSCGHTFARSQDKKRHLREQAICDICQVRPVGRNGKDGRCPSCRALNTLRR